MHETTLRKVYEFTNCFFPSKKFFFKPFNFLITDIEVASLLSPNSKTESVSIYKYPVS